MPNTNTSAKSFLWSFLEQCSSRIVSLGVQIVLARLLSPETFGVLAILLVVTNVADVIAQSGLGSAIIQRKSSDEATYSTAFWLSIGVATVMFCIILCISPIVEGFYSMPGLGGYLNVLAVTVFFNSANSIQRSILQKKMDFKSLFWTSTLAAMISGVVGIAGALAGYGVWALVAQSVSQSIATCIVMATRVSWRPRFEFDKSEVGGLFSYGWKVAATGILGTLYTGISDLVVGRTCSASALGYYSQGRKYPMAAISMATNAIQNVMFPSLAKKQTDREAFTDAVTRALVSGTFIVAPLALFFASAAEPIVALLLSEKWLPCVPVFQMVCISHSIMMITLSNLRAYMALGRSDVYLRLQVVKVLVGSTVICGTAIATDDIYLVALATCLSTLFNILFVDTAYAKQVFGYCASKQFRDIAPSVALAVGAALAAQIPCLFGLGYVLLLIGQTVVFWVVYLFGSKLLKLRGLADCLGIARSILPWRKVGRN